MKKYFLLFVSGLFALLPAAELPPRGSDWAGVPDPSWYLHYDDAAAAARRDNKLIYVLRTGSDWCGWCVRLKNDVLSKPKFKQLADKHFVFLYLDFPRRVRMPDAQKKHNDQVCRNLGLRGGFPSARVITPDGKTIGQISGYSPEDAYVGRLEKMIKDHLPAVPEEEQNPVRKPVRKNSAVRSKTVLSAPDRGTYMSVLSMGTSRNGEGLIFPQSLQLEAGEVIYFRVRCSLPEGRRARVMIALPFTNTKIINSKLGKGECELVAGVGFISPYQLRELELRLVPMDSNEPIETRTIPVDLGWFSRSGQR
ncbi:MAG: thioredoxin family protein [Lentisphaeria bacterium]|nr:thioredoxin family protein [Lentisphaeria bacterium]